MPSRVSAGRGLGLLRHWAVPARGEAQPAHLLTEPPPPGGDGREAAPFIVALCGERRRHWISIADARTAGAKHIDHCDACRRAAADASRQSGEESHLGPFTDLFTHYIDDLAQEPLSLATRRSYASRVASFLAWAKDHAPDQGEWTQAKTTKLYAAHLAETHSPRTVNSHLTAVDDFLAWLGHAVVSVHTPTEPDSTFLRPAERRRARLALRDLPGHRRLIAELLLRAGLKRGEVQEADVSDVDPDGNLRIGPAHHQRTAILPPRLRADLREHARDRTGPLFVNEWGSRVTAEQVTAAVRDLADRAELPTLTATVLRNSFAGGLREVGASDVDIAQALGVSVPQARHVVKAFDRAVQIAHRDAQTIIATAPAPRGVSASTARRLLREAEQLRTRLDPAAAFPRLPDIDQVAVKVVRSLDPLVTSEMDLGEPLPEPFTRRLQRVLGRFAHPSMPLLLTHPVGMIIFLAIHQHSAGQVRQVWLERDLPRDEVADLIAVWNDSRS